MESIVVAIWGKLSVMEMFVIIANSLHILWSIGDI
jgi:hypothetical protein